MEFVLVNGLASLIAGPVAIYALNGWLDDFTSHITIDAALVLSALGCVFFLTLGSVGYQTIRSSRAQPVDMLRDE